MNLPIGQNCLYYEHADTNQKPTAAIVVSTTAQGVLELATFPANSQTVVTRRNVHHVDDEILKRNKLIRTQYGGWDYIDTGAERMEKQKKIEDSIESRQKQERKRREDEINNKMAEHEEAILALHDQAYQPTDIAEVMTERTGYTWTFQKVNGILRKHSKLAAT